MANKIPIWAWAGIAIVVILLYQNGTFAGLLGGGNNAPTDNGNGQYVPSTGLTAVTLNTKDALSATDLNANVSYYIFSKDGKMVTSGTTVSGTATKNVNYGADYDVIAFSDSTYYPARGSFSANAATALSTLNLNPVSNATVNVYDDLTGTTGNISSGLSAQTGFRVHYSVTKASAALNKPVIVVDANATSVTDVSMVGLSKVTCPVRLASTASSGRMKICFQADSITKATGTVIAKGSVLFSSFATPNTADTLGIIVIDTQAYSDPNFVSMTGYHEGTENVNTRANVGASDSASATLYLDG